MFPRPRIVLATTRSFFSFPSPPEQKYQASRILPYTQRQLYELVSDVESYHNFLPYCTASRVISKPTTPAEPLLTELTIGFLGVEQKYVSRVYFKPYESVTATAEDDHPVFKSLKSVWRFKPVTSPIPIPALPSSSPPVARPMSTPTSSTPSPDDARPKPPTETRLSLDVEFAFVNPMHTALSSTVMGQVSDRMIEAFVNRCIDVYG